MDIRVAPELATSKTAPLTGTEISACGSSHSVESVPCRPPSMKPPISGGFYLDTQPRFFVYSIHPKKRTCLFSCQS